jgi:hypothetical protein
MVRSLCDQGHPRPGVTSIKCAIVISSGFHNRSHVAVMHCDALDGCLHWSDWFCPASAMPRLCTFRFRPCDQHCARRSLQITASLTCRFPNNRWVGWCLRMYATSCSLRVSIYLAGISGERALPLVRKAWLRTWVKHGSRPSTDLTCMYRRYHFWYLWHAFFC